MKIQKHLIDCRCVDCQGDRERKSYIEKFKDPEFSSYDFMSLFCATSASYKKYLFDRDNLINFIKLCKDNNEFSELLNSVQLKSNGVFPYSNELEEAVSKLKWGKILYTISPEKNSLIYIFENIPIAELIKNRISYLDEMTTFLNKYTEYEKEIYNSKSNKNLVKK